jgi:hypothetical protein
MKQETELNRRDTFKALGTSSLAPRLVQGAPLVGGPQEGVLSAVR